jgi:hypothetical protein
MPPESEIEVAIATGIATIAVIHNPTMAPRISMMRLTRLLAEGWIGSENTAAVSE